MNRRNTHNITFNGVTKPMSVWARELNIKTETICKRIKLGWAEADLLKPVDERYAHNRGKQIRKRG